MEKFLGDEYFKWQETKSRLDRTTLLELVYNHYTEMSREEYMYLATSPNAILIELIKRLKQMKVLMSDQKKYEEVIARYEGWDIREITRQLENNKGMYG